MQSKRPKKPRKEESEPPDSQHLAVLITADLAQIEADALTHQEADARARLLKCVERLKAIVSGNLTPDVREGLERAAVAINAG